MASIFRAPSAARLAPRSNPEVAIRSQAAQALLSGPLRGQDKFFGAPGMGPVYDYPNPRGPQQGSITLRTWIDPLKLNLIGQDKFFRGAGLGPSYDWPNPRGYVPAVSLKTWIDTPRYYYTFYPNVQTNWPNPRGYVPSISLRTFIGPTTYAPVTYTLTGLSGSYIITGNAADLLVTRESWIEVDQDNEIWTTKSKESETWTEVAKQSETWTEIDDLDGDD